MVDVVVPIDDGMVDVLAEPEEVLSPHAAAATTTANTLDTRKERRIGRGGYREVDHGRVRANHSCSACARSVLGGPLTNGHSSSAIRR